MYCKSLKRIAFLKITNSGIQYVVQNTGAKLSSNKTWYSNLLRHFLPVFNFTKAKNTSTAKMQISENQRLNLLEENNTSNGAKFLKGVQFYINVTNEVFN